MRALEIPVDFVILLFGFGLWGFFFVYFVKIVEKINHNKTPFLLLIIS